MRVPYHLRINGRSIDNNFTDNCLLYRAFSEDDFDYDLDRFKPEHIRFPDYSCHWNRYSKPEDIQYRKNGSPTDGCYSIKVRDAKYKNLARPVHDPIEEVNYENYAHVDVRTLPPGKPGGFIPEPGGKKPPKSLRMEYRMHVVFNLVIEFPPS